jgi:REP element-mobilizing transposase RayT
VRASNSCAWICNPRRATGLQIPWHIVRARVHRVRVDLQSTHPSNPRRSAMSSVWHIEFNPDNLYFVTTSAIRKAHLFQRDAMKQIILDSWDFMRREKWLELYCFVIMPNHVHFIVRCHPSHPIQDVVRDFKKFTAKKIIAQCKGEGNTRVLDFLKTSVRRFEKQTYAVWEDEYMARDVYSPNFLKQKMDYIHNNPLQPHWNLVENAEDYLWSSARFYLLDQPVAIAIDDARVLL